MKKRLLFLPLMLALLLVGPNADAQYNVTPVDIGAATKIQDLDRTVVGGTLNNVIRAGIWLDDKGTIFNFAGLTGDIEIDSTHTSTSRAIVSALANGVFNLDAATGDRTIFITSSTITTPNAALKGFAYLTGGHNGTVALPVNAFSGTILGERTTISIDSTHGAEGLSFWTLSNNATNTGYDSPAGINDATIKLAEIDITAGTGGTGTFMAYGFVSGSITGNTVIDIGAINVESESDEHYGAYGFRVDGNVALLGTAASGINLGSVTAIDTGSGDAFGVSVTGNVAGLTVGDIIAVSAGRVATGISAGGVTGALKVTGAIWAESEGARAFGINVGGAITGSIVAEDTIYATADGEDAFGIRGHGGVTGAGSINVRDIDVYSETGTAYGASFNSNINTTGTLVFRDIIADGGDGAAGFRIGGPGAGNAGLVNGTININSIESDGANFAYGVKVDSITGGSINVGSVEATSTGTNGEAAGFLIHSNFGSPHNTTFTNGTLSAGSVVAEATGTGLGAWASGVAVFGTLGTDATIDVGGIKATSAHGQAGLPNDYGFGASGVYVHRGINNATIEIGSGGIEAISTNAQAYGILVRNNIGGESEITVLGNIVARGAGNGAAGLAVWGTGGVGEDASIVLGNVDASGRWATGVHAVGDIDGTLAINGLLKATATDWEATGLAVGNYAGVVNLSDITGSATVSAINVTASAAGATGANAFGIRAGEVDSLTLRGNIDVTGTGAETSGIRTYGDTNITLGNDVVINTTYDNTKGATHVGGWVGADIWTNGDLNIDLNEHNLTTNRVKVDAGGDMNVTGSGGLFNARRDVSVGGDLNVLGGASARFLGNTDVTGNIGVANAAFWSGPASNISANSLLVSGNNARADLYGTTNVKNLNVSNGAVVSSVQFVNNQMVHSGNITAATTTLNNGATLVIDGTKTELGNITFQTANNRLEIFGNTTEPNLIGTVVSNHSAASRQIFNMSELTEWRIDSQGVLRSFGARSTAQANDNYLAASQIHHKYTAWNAVRDHLISGAGMPRYGYFGQTCHSGFGRSSRNAWANYIGRDSRYRSSFNNNDWKLTSNGIQLGTDFFRTPRNQLGAFFGYENSTGTNLDDRIKGNDYYVGVYGVHVFHNGADLRTVFSYGWQDFDSRRRGADNSVYGMAFKGNTIELNAELGNRRYFGAWSTRPSIAMDWYMNQLRGGQETSGGGNALQYDNTEFSQLFFRFGSDLRYGWGPLVFDSGLYYSYDLFGNDLRSGVSNTAGTLRSSLIGSKVGRSVVSFNLGGSWMVNHKLSLFGGYRGEVVPESAGRGFTHIGHVGGALRW